MQGESSPPELAVYYGLLLIMQTMVSWGLLFVLFKRAARDKRVGERLASKRGGSVWRTALLGLHAGLILIFMMSDGAEDGKALLSLLVSAALVLLVPIEKDLACGNGGLSCGWDAVPYEQLRGWRFDSGVLRYLMAGSWRELDVPPESRPLLRGILRARAGSYEVEASS